MKRASAAGKSPVQRLPVNQRRHRVAPENRKRVATARIKCSGDNPCVQCRSSSRPCEYPVAVEKVTIPRAELEELQKRCASLQHCLKEATRNGTYQRKLASPPPSVATTSSVSMANPQSTETTDDDASAGEGRLLHDPDGTARYLGSTSGATFLDTLKEFMRTVFPLAWPGVQSPETTFLGSLGQYQTHDSRPLQNHDGVDPTDLPVKQDMETMVAQLKYFIQDGNGEYPSGGIFYWGDLDPSDLDRNSAQVLSNPRMIRRLALFNAAFAMTCHLETPTEVRNKGIQLGEPYFMRARFWLGNPLDTTSYTIDHIPVLAMMSIYLVEDEAIQLPPPSEFNGMPPAIGLNAHIELSKICGYIVCNTYRIAPWEHKNISTSTLIDNTLAQLADWLDNLPPELQMIDTPIRNHDRACCELHMFYNQLLILTVRPIFFMAVKKAVADRFTNRNWNLEKHSQLAHIRQCIDAARRNLRLGRWIRDTTLSHKLLTSTLHNIFNAATILLLNQLLFDSFDEYQDAADVNFAIECFEVEARGENNYAIDCARVLNDLKALVSRLRNQTLEDQVLVRSSPLSPPQAQLSATTAYDVGFILNPEVPPGILPSHPQLTPGINIDLYNQLSDWVDDDDFHLYNEAYLV
ncbi:hypothetical protein DL764_005373 [Monosporascus ibericus]|uniref:Zn(2)-C6 fungal-type domain-containing protein n=1 Tax=Monosporascus ibericus TaxID=155417 RepID=A0A4Q4TB84_9PEZI|nr:hypothetical protein DL764_005373 [Monosporascus ibericus]